MRLQNARGASFSASNAFFNTQLLAAQVGGKSASEDVTFKKYDIITLDADKKATLTATPAATAPDVADFKVFELADDNSFTAAAALTVTTDYELVMTTGSTPEFDGAIKILKATAAAGDKVMIVYEAKQTGEHIVAKADADNELLDVTAEVLLRELCNEELYYAFLIMRGKLSGETEWSMTRDGNHGFELQCQTAYCDAEKKLVEVVIVKGEDLVA